MLASDKEKVVPRDTTPFKDEVEFGALEDIPVGETPELFYGSNYTNHKTHEEIIVEETKEEIKDETVE